MSRIGKLPVIIPAGVSIDLHGRTIKITGPKGELKLTAMHRVDLEQQDNQIIVTRKTDDDKAFQGLTRSLIQNMVTGVTEGFSKELEMTGIGYRANVEGEELVLNAGYSHPVRVKAPEGISFKVTEGKIVVTGIDKQLVGQVAADIRAVRKPEPYKGKGIHYVGEYIRRKAGKAAKAGAK